MNKQNNAFHIHFHNHFLVENFKHMVSVSLEIYIYLYIILDFDISKK